MPGIIVFGRRWSVGSDDLIVPATFLVFIHSIWLLVLVVCLTSLGSLDSDSECQLSYAIQIVLYTILWLASLALEASLIVVSLRGTILEDEQRWMSEYLLYVKLVLWLMEIGLTVVTILWVKNHYSSCPLENGYKSVMLGLAVFNCVIFVIALITIWCVFDVAGRSWVRLKNFQKSQSSKSKFQYKRSGGISSRNWRHRKVRRAYQNSWDNRCQLIFCCVGTRSQNSQNSFADIARVLSDFFRDLDVVPSDVIVGLVLLRQRQQLIRFRVVHQQTNAVYQFLSGVKVSPATVFLDIDNKDLHVIEEINHYMHYAVAMYGWPMYLRKNLGIGTCRLCSKMRCCSCIQHCQKKPLESMIVNDNCCGCNFAAFQQMCSLSDTYVIYLTYHVDVGETPFLIAIDYAKRSIIIGVRGTLSLQDVITDLNAEGEPLPIRPINEEWIGHKGMVNAAQYIYRQIKQEHLLTKAFNWDTERSTQDFELVCVGHSLGAGTAAILAIMLKQEFPNTRCFAFSPPGGLLSQQAIDYSRSFVTSVVLGKDVVPRIGLHQLEALRHNLINSIHKSTDPKWKTLTCGLTSFRKSRKEWTEAEVEARLASPPVVKKEIDLKPTGETKSDNLNIHPWDSTVNLSVHQPLYPPGKIIHIVRHYPKPSTQGSDSSSTFKSRRVAPMLKAILAENNSFDEVLISKRMVQDHMPDNVLDALNQMLQQIKNRVKSEGKQQKEASETSVGNVKSKVQGQEQPNSIHKAHLENDANAQTAKEPEVADPNGPTHISEVGVTMQTEANTSVEAKEAEAGFEKMTTVAEIVQDAVVPGSPEIAYETTYPVFGSQTEYSHTQTHTEPFYRYRVYSDSWM